MATETAWPVALKVFATWPFTGTFPDPRSKSLRAEPHTQQKLKVNGRWPLLVTLRQSALPESAPMSCVQSIRNCSFSCNPVTLFQEPVSEDSLDLPQRATHEQVNHSLIYNTRNGKQTAQPTFAGCLALALPGGGSATAVRDRGDARCTRG